VATRVGKRSVDPGELKLKWRDEAAGLGIEFPVPGRPTVIREAPEPKITTSLETDPETSAPESETIVVPPLEITGEFSINGHGSIVESLPPASEPVISPIGVIPESFPLVVSVEDGEEEKNPRWEGGNSDLDVDEFGNVALDKDVFFEDFEEKEDLEEFEEEDEWEL
jgi:hypothetical protein